MECPRQHPDLLRIEFQECKEGVTCRAVFASKQTVWATAKTRYDAYQGVLCEYQKK